MNKLLIAAASLVFGLGTALIPNAASANTDSIGYTDMEICNSVNSSSYIWPHELPSGWGAFGTELRPGWCRVYHNNTGQLRVYAPDESYRFGQPNQGYGDCKNGPWDSNPPDSANGSRETYKTYPHDNCVS
jgi:hypothetical protein